MDPTPQRFVALARSSPWRWRTLRLRVLRGWGRPPLRVLVRRPDGLRVEALDGTLLEAERQEPNRPRLLTSKGGGAQFVRPWSFDTTPTFGDDGLVRRRPSEHEVKYDGPMLQDYRWVPFSSSYDSRCPCCALLFSAESQACDSAAGGPTPADGAPAYQYADAHRITLDVGTGVCVRSEEIGGSRPGWGHEVAIEAVDEPMSDDLFPRRRRSLFRRIWR